MVKLRRATHLVILSRGYAEEALTWTRAVMAKLGLTLNEAKTSVKDARPESFDFLGYSLERHAVASASSVGRLLDGPSVPMMMRQRPAGSLPLRA